MTAPSGIPDRATTGGYPAATILRANRSFKATDVKLAFEGVESVDEQGHRRFDPWHVIVAIKVDS